MSEENTTVLNVDQSTSGIEVPETVQVVEVELPQQYSIDTDSAFAAMGAPNEQLRHSLLNNRDTADQHPITAITGLRDELDSIEALKTVVADKIGVAGYYAWDDGMSRDEFGYFVSLVPHTSSIQICDGADIFGVTVDRAGFVGGQDTEVPRNNTYGLVTTSGLVDVRCESDVNEGDYVISNIHGVAKKTASGCGYKVIAKENKKGVDYAAISLGVQACVTDAIGRDVQHIQTRLDDAEINIAAAMNTANSAYNKAVDSDVIAEEVKKQMQDAMNKIEDMDEIVDSANEAATSTSVAAAQARAIAENAVTTAVSLKDEAIGKANEAWAKADNVATEMNSLCANIDKYSVGEHSQAYGLTLEQAQSILQEGMIYIPTVSHTETYSGRDYNFSQTFYYTWTTIDSVSMWVEAYGEVWFGPEAPAGKAYTYWYDGSRLFVYNKRQEKWSEVATVAGNINNRITSMIRQDMDEIALDIANAGGSVAGINARLTDAESKVNSYAYWPTDENENRFNLSTIDQSANKDGSSLALAVVDKNGEQIINGATIVLNQSGGESVIKVSADNIMMSGKTTFITSDGTNENGATVIDGSRIVAGSIEADKIDATDLHVNAANIDGTITANKIDATSGYIGGFYIEKYSIRSTPVSGFVEFNINSADSDNGDGYWLSAIYDGETTFSVSKEGVLHATGVDISGKIITEDAEIAGWTVDDNSIRIGSLGSANSMWLCRNGTSTKATIGTSDEINKWCIAVADKFGVTNEGKLYAADVDLSGIITANAGHIGSWDIEGDAMFGLDEDDHRVVITPKGVTATFDVLGSDGLTPVTKTIPWSHILMVIDQHIMQ